MPEVAKYGTLAHRAEIRRAVNNGDYERLEREEAEASRLLNEVHNHLDAGEYFVKNIEGSKRLTTLIYDLMQQLKKERELCESQ